MKQAIYPNLVEAIARTGWEQRVFAAVRTTAEAAHAKTLAARTGVPISAPHILNRADRLLFRSKVKKVVRAFGDNCPLGQVSLCHAHFLYSDGAVALQLKRKMGIPYVVAVRNTDINGFMRYRPDLGAVGRAVLANASRVLFLSPSYRVKLIKRLRAPLAAVVAEKAMLIPNGITSAWIEGDSQSGAVNGSAGEQDLKVLYVGDFSPNKNLRGLVRAVQLLREQHTVTLTLVGGGGRDEDWICAETRKTDGWLRIHGRVNNPTVLREIYRRHDVFAMPSFHETFGVVYIEALSQGLPVVCSRGEGVDGYFDDDGVMAATDPSNPQEIAAAIELQASRLPGIRAVCREAARRFSWMAIAQQYDLVYRCASGEKIE